MRPLPTGTVTLLFSDIEGSTVLLERLGRHWGEALSAQRAILRSCFASHHGHEMGTEGDSFFVVFDSAHDALDAALEGRHRLQEHAWPEGVTVRVRMGLHTGEPQRHEDGYIGIDVHRAARIASTASGGQIVLSETTRTMLGRLPDDLLMRDQGWHRLKDLDDPEHLYDVVEASAPEPATSFPPLKSLGVRANLPAPPAPLIGREEELAALLGRFEDDGARLVTLTGPGGTGKTRLALAAAEALGDHFAHGIFFAELHTADRAPLMWAGIAEAVGARGEGEESPEERALRFLADREVLLVLDNLEQIPEADQVIDHLLTEASGVSMLCTSRRPTHLAHEYELPVPPLEMPGPQEAAVEDAERSAAVQLFVRRARMAHPRFALTEENAGDVIELCRRLDGLPLAIELAAARSRVLSPRAILGRIDQRLGLGVTAADRAPRQRSLGDTIAWSYDLLDEPDQQLFRRLGVFSGSADLADVETVAGTAGRDIFDGVASLVDASLAHVVDGPDGEPKVAMLQTIRSFARARLDDSDEAAQIRLAHARWCSALAREIRDQLGGARQLSALDLMERVEEDIRAALDWSLRPPDEVGREVTECGFELLTAMTTYWYRFGYQHEGRGWHERGVALAGDVETRPVVDTVHGLAIMLSQLRDDRATGLFEQALHMAERLGDRDLEAREANSLGIVYREAGDIEGARQMLERSLSLARDVGSENRESTALSNMVTVLVDLGDFAGAARMARDCAAADAARGNAWAAAICNANLTMALLRCEGPDIAYDHVSGIAREVVTLGDIELSISIVELFGCVLAERGDPALAARLVGTSDAQREAAGLPRSGPDQVFLDESLAPARASVSTAEWDAAYAAGTRLSIDAAIEAALGPAVA